MNSSNAADRKVTENPVSDKGHEKLAEKRRALGRGLESLLPGPRVVATPPPAPAVIGSIAAEGDSSQLPAPGSHENPPVSSSSSGGAVQTVAPGSAPDGEAVFTLAIDLIDENPYQTRRDFNQDALQELARSIEVQGVLQPISVRPGKDGRFVLILGERRLRASRLAEKNTIPVIVKRVSDQQAAEMTLVENLQRRDLGCVEQAEAFADMSANFKLTQEQIGRQVGVSREHVSNYMRLLTLPEGVIGALQKGLLSYSHARTLLRLRDNTQIWKMAQKVMAEKISVSKLEDMVLGMDVPGVKPLKKEGEARWVDPNVKAAQRSLEEVLGMRVRIRDKRGRGKIQIEYATLEDFDRVVGMLKGR